LVLYNLIFKGKKPRSHGSDEEYTNLVELEEPTSRAVEHDGKERYLIVTIKYAETKSHKAIKLPAAPAKLTIGRFAYCFVLY
jgi:hypothetical protein